MSTIESEKIKDQMERLLSVSEAADRLGVSIYFLYRQLESGKIKSVKIGKRRLLRWSDVREIIQFGLER